MPSFKTYLLFFLLLLSACSTPKNNLITPIHSPLFIEKGTTRSLEPALNKQIQKLTTYNADTTITIRDTTYNYRELIFSLQHFQYLYQKYAGIELHKKIVHDFDIYQTTGRKSYPANLSLITGYFEPIFAGSPQRTETYQSPLYSPPAKTPSHHAYTRRNIETKNLLQGNEIAYLKDPIDSFVLHIQGSGKLQYPDGSLHSFGYAGNNGHNYKSIGKLLVDEKKMSLENINMDSIRDYLNENPQEQSRILHHNPRFIFFTEKEDKAPIGSNGIALTAERSIAIDQQILPWQALCFIDTTLPTTGEQEGIIFSSFMLPQDSGAAIKGAGRVDIFWGNGKKAKNIASHMKEKGNVYFLIKKGLGKPSSPNP